MITISDRSRTAVAALVELAHRSGAGPVPIIEVAEARRVPPHVLEQVFAALRRSGVLQSQRGVKGGYSLARGPEHVTVLDVVETVDGALREAPLDGVWGHARDRLVETLSEVTIADLVAREASARAEPMFHI